MKISVDKDSLLKSINIADSVVSSKNINTVLSNCLFNISRDQIEIIATDNEMGIRTRIDAVNDTEGSFAANGKKFAGILKELPDDELIIDIDDSFVIEIQSKSKEVKGHYSLIGASSDEYPEIPDFLEENSIEIDQAIFKEMLKKVVYAASNDTIKPVFNGIYLLSDKKGVLSAVATDSRRLSIISRTIENEVDLNEGIIIPLKTVNEVSRLLDSTGRAMFSFDDSRCFFRIGSTEIISRVVDGQFPNYKQVIPLESSLEAIIETRKLINSVKRAMVFTREPANKIVLNFSDSNLIIEANTPELGEAEEEIAIETSSSEEVSIGINAQFLLETLKEIDSFSLKCRITGQMSPVTFIPEDDSNYISVIMPIQIKSNQG